MMRSSDGSSDAPLLRVVFTMCITVITLAAVYLELAPHRLTRAPQHEATRVRVGQAQHVLPMTTHTSTTSALHVARESLAATHWEPPARFNEVWIHAAVSNMLAPWASAGVDQNFTAYLDKWGVHQRKKHCWGVVQIRNMTATRSGCAGNGRYWLILNDALAYMRNANITAEDSTIVLTKGDDDPKIRTDSKNKMPIPFVVSMTNNGSFYDVVFPTVTRSSFVGRKWETELDTIIKLSSSFSTRNGTSAVWRGSGPHFETGDQLWNHPRVMLARYSVDGTLPCVDARLTGRVSAAAAQGALNGGGLFNASTWERMSGDRYNFRDFKFVMNVGNNGFADRTKGLLASGNVMIYIDNGFVEWYYPALVHGVHYYDIPLNDIQSVCTMVEALQKSPVAATIVSSNAQAFVRETLRVKVRNMYVAEILIQWGRLFNAGSKSPIQSNAPH